MTTTPIMTCGHAANAIRTAAYGVKYDPPLPCCAICDCVDIAKEQPDISGRNATCAYCGHKAPSSAYRLAFFEHCPDKEHDRYYCGCRGWD